MTNTAQLKNVIRESGMKKTYIAKEMGITNQSLHNKLSNRREFKASEIIKLCDLLSISNEERDHIFFAG